VLVLVQIIIILFLNRKIIGGSLIMCNQVEEYVFGRQLDHRVVLIPKSTAKNSPSGYRPISLELLFIPSKTP